MTTPRPQKPFQSTYARLLKAFAAGALNLDEMKNAGVSPKAAELKASVVTEAAKAGQIRAATRNPDPDLSTLGTNANELMSKLIAAETTSKLNQALRTSLESIHGQHQPTLMLLNDQLATVEKMRKNIYEAVTGKTLTSEQINKLEKEISKYSSEIDALKKKIEPFINKVQLQASNITPSITIPSKQSKLTN